MNQNDKRDQLIKKLQDSTKLFEQAQQQLEQLLDKRDQVAHQVQEICTANFEQALLNIAKTVIFANDKPENITELDERTQQEISWLFLRFPHQRKTFLSFCKNAEIGEDYFSGNYLDQARTTYHVSCKVCGLYQKIASESHGYYG